KLRQKRGNYSQISRKTKELTIFTIYFLSRFPQKVFYSPLESSQKELHNKHTGIFKNKSTC
ncbi:hypothetical protein, partial [Bacteroides xylanisolvens]|uniref:hypothetical protein n=1 Tax=Bacteroides xylanisolvens TaxID=371601 RepID=UPI0019614A65